MALLQSNYGTNGQTFTITLASLASQSAGAYAGRQSTEVDNTTNLFLDALVLLSIKSNAAGTSTTGTVEVYAYGTVDNGTNRTESAGASDAALTLTNPPNAKLIGVMNVVANATTYKAGPFSVAAAFGGILPAKWGIVVINRSGAALDATESNHAKLWQGVQGQSV